MNGRTGLVVAAVVLAAVAAGIVFGIRAISRQRAAAVAHRPKTCTVRTDPPGAQLIELCTARGAPESTAYANPAGVSPLELTVSTDDTPDAECRMIARKAGYDDTPTSDPRRGTCDGGVVTLRRDPRDGGAPR